MYDRDKRRMASTVELASETAWQGAGLTRRYNDNTPMHYILLINKNYICK